MDNHVLGERKVGGGDPNALFSPLKTDRISFEANRNATRPAISLYHCLREPLIGF
jgi:hypothetical protein